MTAAQSAVRPAMTEAELQKAVTDLCAWRGIWWYHASQPQRDNPGFPDLVLLGSRGALFAELKTETGRLSAAQSKVGGLIRKAGLSWSVWRPEDLHSGLIQREIEAIR